MPLLALLCLPVLLFVAAVAVMMLWQDLRTSPALQFGLATGVVVFLWLQVGSLVLAWRQRRRGP